MYYSVSGIGMKKATTIIIAERSAMRSAHHAPRNLRYLATASFTDDCYMGRDGHGTVIL